MKLFTRLTLSLLFTCGIVGIWAQTQIGNNLTGCSNCRVANSVTISSDGGRFIMGNPGVASNNGAIEAFTATDVSYTFTGAIFNPVFVSEFGYVTALSGDASVLAVSGMDNSNNGVVYIYSSNGNNFDLDTNLTAAATGSSFGQSVSLSDDGTRMAIGDSQETQNPPMTNQFGAVHVYEKQNGTWMQIGSTLYPVAGSTTGTFGSSLAISGDGQRLIVGEHIGPDTTGKVTVYEWSTNDWVPVGDPISGTSGVEDHFGFSVDLSEDGSRIAVGAPRAGAATNAGAVRMYEWQGGQWQQAGPELLGDGENDYFGYSVSMSGNGNRVAVGAPSTNAGMGYTRIFDWNFNTWVSAGTVQGQVDGDLSGYSVALSNNSARLMIGAPGNNPSPNGGVGRLFDLGIVSSLDASSQIQELSVYPNPTAGIVGLDLFAADQVQVYDLFGRLILADKGIKEIDLSSVPAGMYILLAQQEGLWYQAKVTKR